MSLPILSQEAGLIRYLEEIKKFPMLTESEERTLALAWHENGDIAAAQRLVTSHLRLVAKIAMQFKGYGLPIVDIISEGNIGLMTAVKKFDPKLGYRLSTYAMWWIKATIQDYILKSWSMVKMGTSASHKKLFFNLRKVRAKLVQSSQGQLPYNANEIIAKELGVEKSDVDEMASRFDGYEDSLNDTAYDDSAVEAIDIIAEPSDNQEVALIARDDYDRKKELFKRAFASLNDREQQIIAARRLQDKPIKLEELSLKYGVSSERIRQIEEAAMKKLMKVVNDSIN